MMKHYIPEVKSVESVEDPDTPEVKAAKEKAEKELRKDFEDELAASLMKWRRWKNVGMVVLILDDDFFGDWWLRHSTARERLRIVLSAGMR